MTSEHSHTGRDGSPSRPPVGCLAAVAKAMAAGGEASLPQRKWLRHEVPAWGQDGVFFITINGRLDDGRPLTYDATFAALRDSVIFYHGSKWWVHVWLCMPDHLHALVSFPAEASMKNVVADWKRYTARTLGIKWQSGFFDHRLRRDESFEEKAYYIRMNPVRAGLVNNPEAWPFVITAVDIDSGRAGKSGRDGSPSCPSGGCLGEASLPLNECAFSPVGPHWQGCKS